MTKRLHYFAPHKAAYDRMVGSLVVPAIKPEPFDVPQELRGADDGDVLVVFGSMQEPPLPPAAYDAARDRGMIVWHISDSYASAKAERDAADVKVKDDGLGHDLEGVRAAPQPVPPADGDA